MAGPKSSYLFRETHPCALFGTASDRYKGWLGQIYNRSYKMSSRTKTFKKQKFKEEVVEVACVKEYFEHFDFVEIDYTFYRPLLDPDGQPESNYSVLESYNSYMPEKAKVVLKVPQVVTARHAWMVDPETKKRVWTKNSLSPNERARIFRDQFYEPAQAILGDKLAAFFFEFEYQRVQSGMSPGENIRAQEALFDVLPSDTRYHIEERTDRLKTEDYFRFLRDRKIGNVFSHWSFLPPLRKQFAQAGGIEKQNVVLIRLLTPRGMRYEDAYARYAPFAKMIDVFPDMIEDTVRIILEGLKAGVQVFTASNNRAGGNAPDLTRRLVESLKENL